MPIDKCEVGRHTKRRETPTHTEGQTRKERDAGVEVLGESALMVDLLGGG